MISRRTLGLLASLGLLFLMLAVWVATRTPDPNSDSLPSLDSQSTGIGGGRVLYDWLHELGYPVDRLAYRDWTLPRSTRILVLLVPNEPIKPEQIEVLGRWLADGGTLIFAARSSAPITYSSLLQQPGDTLLSALGLTSTPSSFGGTPDLAQPVPNPAVQRLTFQQSWAVAPRSEPAPAGGPKIDQAEAMTPVVTGNGHTLVGLVPVGRGRVWVLADAEWLSNRRLAEADHARLAVAMLGGLKPEAGNVIWFDEWHHGYYAHEASFTDQLTQSAWGRSLIATFLIGWLYLAWSGRRFGRSVPLRELSPTLRRSTGELVTSLAHIFRRAGQRDWAVRTALEQTCQRLAALYGLNPAQPPPALIEALDRSGRLSPETIRRLRQAAERVQRGAVSEHEVLDAGRTLARIEHDVREGAA